MSGFEKFLNWARENNWVIKEAGTEKYELPEVYRGKLDEWEEIARKYKEISSADGLWQFALGEMLRCDSEIARKYMAIAGGSSINETDEESENNSGDLPVLWDTFKNISLGAAEPNEKANVEKWWNRHFPFLIYVGWEYEYYAVDIETGTVVNAFEPFFEEAEKAADNLNDFFEKIVDGNGDMIL